MIPNRQYEDRIQQVDFRAAKLLKSPFGRFRVTFDLYNALNSSAVVARNDQVGTSGIGWGGVPANIPGRLAKLGTEWTWLI
jgi:hypothetical protein